VPGYDRIVPPGHEDSDAANTAWVTVFTLCKSNP